MVLGELNATLNDNISGIREIKAFTREEMEASRVGSYIDRYRSSLLRALRLMATFEPFIELTSSLGTIVIIYFGGRLALAQQLPIEDLVAFFLYLDMFYQPIRALSGAWEQVQESTAGAERVAELLDEEPDVQDRPDALELPGRAQGHLSFQDVTFRYSQGENVLEHITLDVPAGSVVALVGPTGVGKTTLASLIPRFYDVCEGAVILDDHDIRDLTLRSLPARSASCCRTSFCSTVRRGRNILFGRPDATEEEVMAAAQAANAHDFIQRLPDGYDTLLESAGSNYPADRSSALRLPARFSRMRPS